MCTVETKLSPQFDFTVAQLSICGRKPINQDSCGFARPQDLLLRTKGVGLAVADGISSSAVSGEAAAVAVRAFLDDYFSTPETWSVKESARRVLTAINSWLYSRTLHHQGDRGKDAGYVCTLSAAVVKGSTVHIFHVGDSRVYLLRGGKLEQLTIDHRVWFSQEQSYLSRAFGVSAHIEIDYYTRALEVGDVLLLSTDGIHEHVSPAFLNATLSSWNGRLEEAVSVIAEEAMRRGSTDNLSVQVLRINQLPLPGPSDVLGRASELPCPPQLQPDKVFDGYRIISQLHVSHRSHLWLAKDVESGEDVVLKVPSLEMTKDRDALERLLLEEWIARRIDNPHTQSAPIPVRQKRALYSVVNYIDGQTLARWMSDNPRPSLSTVRGIIAQLVVGLRALHRKSVLHLDLRPQNILIDGVGKITIIDFGAAKVAGISELSDGYEAILGTEQYSAPEYLLGEKVTAQSDLFSLGVITYQMLTGHLPYGTRLAAARNRSDAQRLLYQSALEYNPDLPDWIDNVLHKAVQIQTKRRYSVLSEFLNDLDRPSAPLKQRAPSILELNSVRIWQTVSFALSLCCLALLLGS